MGEQMHSHIMLIFNFMEVTHNEQGNSKMV